MLLTLVLPFFKFGDDNLKISKVLNNNAVLSRNEKRKEVILLGSGIAYQKKIGDEIDKKRVERTFTQDNFEMLNSLQQILSDIPYEIVDIADKIISNAKVELGKDYSDNIYISLPEHLEFMIERYKKGLIINNKLLIEIKQMYKEIFSYSLRCLDYINDFFEINLPEDEAANIALHLINAENDSDFDETIQMIKLVKDVLEIVEKEMDTSLDEDSLYFYRLVTHLKFFYFRINNMEDSINDDFELLKLVKKRYKESYYCARKVKTYIEKEHNYSISENDLLYITIHIQKASNN